MTGKQPKAGRARPKTIDEYIGGFPRDVQTILKRIRATIRDATPDAEESISYGIAAFELNGPLVYFAAFKSHVGIYPMTAATREKFKKELSTYASGKATAKFPFGQAVPYALIGRIVKFRAKENSKRVRAKAKRK